MIQLTRPSTNTYINIERVKASTDGGTTIIPDEDQTENPLG
ncbi:hypothetical protein [Bacteroides ndongoniae]|nr:hypothetical protein [Bacteroides ndongoniae]